MKDERENKTSPSLGGALAGTSSSIQEAVMGLMGGVAYGLVSPIVGHPFDTVKTKMQAESIYKNSTVWKTIAGTYHGEGIRGFYRGFIPPLLGSMIYRGAAFSAYSGAYSASSNIPMLHEPIPFTGGLRSSVLVGSFAAAVVRATIESPLDFIKLRKQIGQEVMKDATSTQERSSAPQSASSLKSFFKTPLQNIQHLYYGYTVTLFRTFSLLGPFFITIDYSVRYIPEVVNAPLIGPFFKGGICSTAAWAFAFPFETAKSVIQADTTGQYKNLRGGTWKVLYQLYTVGGVKRLYRGFAPGAGRSFVANGASMIVYSWFQDVARQT